MATVVHRTRTSYPPGVPMSLEYPTFPAWGFLERAASEFPERTACIYYDQQFTWREMWEQSLRMAGLLRSLGVEPGDRVGILLPNVPEYPLALNAIWMAGGVAVAISPLMVTEEVSKLLEATDCKTVVCLDMLAPLVLDGSTTPDHTLLVSLREQLPTWQQIGYLLARLKTTGRLRLTEPDRVLWMWDELDNVEPISDPVVVDAETTPAYILPTGGTTGTPKAVTLSHRNLIANAWQQYHWAGATMGEEIFLAVLPFFHSYGLSASVMTGTAMAATLIMHHRFNTRMVLRLIERHEPTIFHAVPAMLRAMNERLRRKSSDLNSLKWVISGGAPLDVDVAKEFAEFSGALVVEGFGLSECSPVTHVGPLNKSAKLGCIGLPLPDTECRIVDVETGQSSLPPGEVGELIVRAPQVMLGYWNHPEETAAVLRDDWLYTGDLATFDEDGFYKIVDRKKDLIITSGYNVYPGEVEAMLRNCPGVKDAAVIGVPDERRGEVVKAMVVLDGNTEWNQDDLERYCREHLSAHKRPRIFELVEGDLPRNFLGKVLRRHLRDMKTELEPTPETAS